MWYAGSHYNLSTATGGFTNVDAQSTWTTVITWLDVQPADIDGDGRDDIIGRVQQTGHWWVGRSTLASTNTSTTQPPLNGPMSNELWSSTWTTAVTWLDVRVADVDGDGDQDLVGRASSTGAWWVARSAEQKDQSFKYAYDGLRYERENAGDHIVLAFLDPDGSGPQPQSLTNRYLFGPNVDQILADEQLNTGTTQVLWPLTDNLGTVRDIITYNETTSTATVINHITYDTFGNIISELNPTTNSAPTEGSIKTGDFAFAFTGREFDFESEVYYHRGRYYASSTAQWLSNDPLGFEAGDTNLRRVVENNVVNATDPSGLSFVSKAGVIAVKKAAQRMLKKIVQEAIETRLKKWASKEGLQQASKQFGKEALEILDKFDRATSFNPSSVWSWCSEAAEFIPVGGDIYGGVKFGKAVADAKADLRRLEQKMDAAEAAAAEAAEKAALARKVAAEKAPSKTVLDNAADGAAREVRVHGKLSEHFTDASVQRERYLRTADGKRAIDPLTGEARRIDHAVIQNGQVRYLVETTSKTADKTAQLAKEARIRANGGTFIRDKVTRELIDVSNVPTRVTRRK